MKLTLCLLLLFHPLANLRSWLGHRVNAVANAYVKHVQREHWGKPKWSDNWGAKVQK